MADTSLRASTERELDSTLARLEVVWDNIGLTEDQREDRRHHFYGHIVNLCEKIIDDETALKTRITNSIERNTRDILKFYEELCVDPEESVEGLTLLELDAVLQERVKKLQQIRNERLETLRHLQEKDEGLCELLSETPYYIPSGLVPSTEDLQAVEEHVKSMEKEKEEREETFRTLKAGLLMFLEQLEQSPEDSFSQEVICSDDEDVPLGKAYLHQLRTVHSDLEFQVNENQAKSLELREKITTLWGLLQIPHEEQQAFLATAPKHTPSNIAKLEEELQRLKLLRLQNLSFFIEKLQEELTIWWDKCYIGKSERERVKAVYSGEANEEVLVVCEREVQKWKKYYNENSELFELVSNFLSLFDQMLELEERAKDPSRLFNTRGGALLQEEKAKKKLKNEIPRVQEHLKSSALAWEKREGRPFMVHGLQITQYIEELWESRDMKKEAEKNKRQQAKAALEINRGVNVITPVKTPGPPPSSKKRVLEVDDPVGVKRPKQLTVAGGVPYKSSSKSPVRSPIKTPRGQPLSECNMQLPLPQVISISNESLHSTITYDKFEAGIGERCREEVIQSSILDEATPPISSYFPAVDQMREKRLRDTLHLVSPIKAQCRGKQFPSLNREATLRSSLRRVASHPCLSVKPQVAGLRATSKPLSPRFPGIKEHPVRFLM